MRSPVRIYATRPAEREYYEMSETDWFPDGTADPSSLVDPQTCRVSDVVTVDLHQSDLQHLLELDHLHRIHQRNPQVQAAWEQYVMLLRLTGADR